MNQGVPQDNETPQEEKTPIDPPAMTNVEIRLEFLTLAQAMTT